MALADSLGIPSPPDIFAIYRGFYVLPSDNLDLNSIVRVDFFVSRSPNGRGYEGNDVFSYGDNEVGFFAVHAGLDENTFYGYRCQYVCSDGSKTPMGQIQSAGQAQLIASSDLNIDQLASKEYSTGLITSGIFQGVIFRTAPIDPKVQMDPSGIWAEDGMGRKTFYLHADGSQAYFSGQIDLQESSAVLDPATPSEISWGGEFVVNVNDQQNIPGQWYNVQTAGNSYPWGSLDPPTNSQWVCNMNPNAVSYWLEAENYGFNIPTEAVITGIQLWLHKGQGAFGTVSDADVYLLKGGTFVGVNKAQGGQWTIGDQWVSYGGPADLWGTTWSPMDTNSNGFGAAVICQNTSGSQGANAAIYDVQIIVYYNVLELGINNAWIQGVFTNNEHGVWIGAGGSGGPSAKLIDNSWNSDFIYNSVGGQTNLGGGSANITASANTTFSIAHGMPRQPITFVMTPNGYSASISCFGADSSNIYGRATTNINGFVNWIAIA